MLIIELTEFVKAPQNALWTLLSDVLRRGTFVGYEITEARRATAVAVGPDFRWSEKGTLLGKRYECECGILGWEPPEWLCFGSRDLFHVSYELLPAGDGTRVAYRCELPQTRLERRESMTEICRKSLRTLKQQLEEKAASV